MSIKLWYILNDVYIIARAKNNSATDNNRLLLTVKFGNVSESYDDYPYGLMVLNR